MLTQITVDTGTASPHILGISDAIIQASLFGQDFVSEDLDQFQATIVSQNEVRISSGVVCIGGHIGYIPYGSYESCSIATGNIGYKRKDLIVARYSRASGLDFMGLYTYKGNPALTNPVLPTYKNEDVLQGGYTREIPICEVNLDGLSITSVNKYNYSARFLRNLAFLSSQTDYGFVSSRANVIGNKMFMNYQEDKTVSFVQNATYGAYEYTDSYSFGISVPDGQGLLLFPTVVPNSVYIDGNVIINGAVMYQPIGYEIVPYEFGYGINVNYKLISKFAAQNYPLRVSHNAEMLVNY